MLRSNKKMVREPSQAAGFTLIEMMIVVGVIAILAAVALPSYKDYVIRGKLVAGVNALAALRAQMEQYYQDNRTYQTVGTITSPCATSTADTFTITCSAPSATTYTLTATGSRTTVGAVYTVDQKNQQTTTGLPATWGSVPTANKCWILRKGDSC